MNTFPFSQISLADWQLVKVSGQDNLKFLQGQVTIDMNQLIDQQALFAAHCDPKGKMWSNLLLFKRHEDIFYLVRKSVAEKQIAELKKYAVFSKVTIEPEHTLTVLGLAGQPIPTEISAKLTDKNCLTQNGITYIKLPLPSERIIMVSHEALPSDALPSDEWKKLDMLAGYPIIDAQTMGQLLPQACNMQMLGAISFDKGCYCGQEMVARAEYRGANKRALYMVAGHGDALPAVGDTLEYQLGDSWRESGQILAALKLNQPDAYQHTIYVQIILNNGIDIKTKFRIKGQTESELKLFC